MQNLDKLDLLSKVEEIAKDIDNIQSQKTKNAFQRYPITFSLLSTTGLASVIYSIEGIFNQVSFLKNNPIVVLIIGLLILFFTGSAFKMLSGQKIKIDKK